MARSFLQPINLNKLELQNAVAQNLGSAPSSPVKGLLYFDTVSNHLFVWNGTAWEQCGGASSGVSSVSAGDSTITIGGTGSAPTVAVAKALDHTYVTDFDTQVRTSTLNQMAAPTADVSLNSHKLTNVTDPASAQDAATKNYVDSVAQGLSAKPSATAATVSALPANTYSNGASGVGATLTATANASLSGNAAVDGATLAVGNYLLVKNEAAGANNGLYKVTQLGDGTHPYILTRAVELDASSDYLGAYVFIETGTVNASSGWVCANTSAPTVGTTAISFTQFSGAGEITAGTGLSKSGNTISLSTPVTVANGGTGASTLTGLVKGNGTSAFTAAAAGSDYTSPGGTENLTNKTLDSSNTVTLLDTKFTLQDNTTPSKQMVFELSGLTSSTTRTLTVPDKSGTIATTSDTISGANVSGNISGNAANVTGTVLVANGGTGATTAAGARSNLGAVGKYSATIGDGSSTSISITQATHGLATNGQMLAQIFDASTGAQVDCDISINNTNGTVTFAFATAPASAAYRVVLVG